MSKPTLSSLCKSASMLKMADSFLPGLGYVPTTVTPRRNTRVEDLLLQLPALKSLVNKNELRGLGQSVGRPTDAGYTIDNQSMLYINPLREDKLTKLFHPDSSAERRKLVASQLNLAMGAPFKSENMPNFKTPYNMDPTGYRTEAGDTEAFARALAQEAETAMQARLPSTDWSALRREVGAPSLNMEALASPSVPAPGGNFSVAGVSGLLPPELHGRGDTSATSLRELASREPLANPDGLNVSIGRNGDPYSPTSRATELKPSTRSGPLLSRTDASLADSNLTDAIHKRMSATADRELNRIVNDPEYGYGNTKPMSTLADYEKAKGFDWSKLVGPGVGALGGLAAGRLASSLIGDDEDEAADPRERARIRSENSRRKLMLGLLGAGLGGAGGHYLLNA